MRAFIITVEDFFRLRESEAEKERFHSNMKEYVIPEYQREYTWEEERVQSLLNDVEKGPKFLGYIFLDKDGRTYEIVDGQQRITTITLALAAFFNAARRNEDTRLSEMQRTIQEVLCHNQGFVLRNDTIGPFLQMEGNQMLLQISDDPDIDIYQQKDTFESTYSIILECVQGLMPKKRQTVLENIYRCRFSILISEEGDQESIEQIFLDINEKSQHLKPEDIFKGYCFKNYYSTHHSELKKHWSELKRCSIYFANKLGYHGLGEYLYHYFLSFPETKEITPELRIKQAHYLEEMTAEEVSEALKNMVSYGTHIRSFCENLEKSSYRFEDLVAGRASQTPKSIQTMKDLCGFILLDKRAQYQKFSFLLFIHYLMKYKGFSDCMTWGVFQQIVSNYYVYCMIFLNSSAKKNKGAIDRRMIATLQSGDPWEKMPNHIREAAKQLRTDAVENFSIPEKFEKNLSFALFSVLDFYRAQDNTMTGIYDPEERSRKEHFIIHDNRLKKVLWMDKDQPVPIYLNKLDQVSKKKGLLFNYLAIDPNLNEKLGECDIVEKAGAIEQFYHTLGRTVPQHVSIVLEHLEQLPSFQNLKDLKNLKEGSALKPAIEKAYENFVYEYFGQESVERLSGAFLSAFRKVFQN